MKLFFCLLLLVAAHTLTAQNVGIGTTAPTKGRLVVNGTVGAVSALFGDNTTGVAIENSFPGVGLNTYYNGTRKYIAAGYGGLFGLNPNNGDMYFMNTATTGTADANAAMLTRLFIEGGNGNVGIGTSTPKFPLTFADNLGGKIALWGGNNVATDPNYGIGIQSSLMQFYTDVNTADFAFGYGNSSNFTQNLRIKGDGNIAIGGPVWSSAANDRVIRFGDGDFVHIGEVGADDKMELKANSFLFKTGKVQIQDGSQGAGKAFVSDANGVGTWSEQAFTNTERFKITGYGGVLVSGSVFDTNLSTTVYNFSANIVINLAANTITFNKAGLYRLEGNVRCIHNGAGFDGVFSYLNIDGANEYIDYSVADIKTIGAQVITETTVKFVTDRYMATGTVLKIRLDANGYNLYENYLAGYLISE